MSIYFFEGVLRYFDVKSMFKSKGQRDRYIDSIA